MSIAVAGALLRQLPASPLSKEKYLEGEMFEEMSRAIGLVGFGPATRIDPYPYG